MKKLNTLIGIGNILFLLLPFFLYCFVLFHFFTNGFFNNNSGATLKIWKIARDPIYYFYLVSSFFIFINWLQGEKQNIQTFFFAFRNWLIGLVFLFLSYALAAVTIDLLFTIILLITRDPSIIVKLSKGI